MKIISIWQPFAGLLVKGYKVFETRSWPAPAAVIGQTIGIASTKNLKPEQRAHFADPEFQNYYARLGLAETLEEMPLGYLLGTVKLDSIELVTEEFLDDVSDEEQQYGWFNLGGYAWRMVDPVEFEHPIIIRGKQGIFDWEGQIPNAKEKRPTSS